MYILSSTEYFKCHAVPGDTHKVTGNDRVGYDSGDKM